jgi:3-oxoacyl-[acyl-carrier protein] reductase
VKLQLKNRRVLVTGSSRGIGRGIAEAFLAEGAKVAITGRDRPTVQRLRKAWVPRFGGEQILNCTGDLTSPAGIRRALQRIEKAWGGLDVLVLNLGSGRSVAGLAPAEEWQRVLNLNLVAAMEMLRQAEELLSHGRQPAVVFVGSIAGLESLGAPMPYGAAKAALRHAMKAAAQTLAARGIRVNMVAPGNIHFPGGTWERKLAEAPEATAAMLATQVPLQRFGTVEEVAAAVVFLAASPAAFITGACLTVDGGQTRT